MRNEAILGVTCALLTVTFAVSCVYKACSVPTKSELMWEAYCEAYGVNPDAPTHEQRNAYLEKYVKAEEWEEVKNEY